MIFFLGTKKSRGFGFITYSMASEADAAFEEQPHTIDTNTIETKWATLREKKKKAGVGGSTESHHKLSIGGLNYSKTDVTNKLDVKGVEHKEAVVEAVPAAVSIDPADDLGGQMDFNTALREVLKSAFIHDGLSRGHHQTINALNKRQAVFGPLFCILAENCKNAPYKNLVEALCRRNRIPILTVPDNIQLGEYAILSKLDADGKKRKVVRCSSLVVSDWGKEGPAHDFIREHFKQQTSNPFPLMKPRFPCVHIVTGKPCF